MASDRARISFDPTRAYRSVLAQQGRVTLEADVNEAGAIALETLRLETLDIVGPTGTPDDGYAVTPSGAGLTVGAGIMYLGGWRLSLDQAVNLAKQPDWLDQPGLKLAGDEVISLLVTEQSVCAVEDQALRDVALGGPDSAARLRLMQQVLATPIKGDTCADGAAAMGQLLTADGVTWDPDTLELLSGARLEVGFVPPTTPADPCSPAAAGGYLGADNQLIRVTVTAFNPTAKTGSLLWGWNNASFLYRATSTDAAAGVMTLTSVPVDQEHAPQLGQAVEILRSRANLGDNNFIAADAGFVTTLAQAYSFDTGTLTLAAPLPAEYASDPNPLFVRVWQAIVPFNAGQATALDTTSGLTVSVTLPALPTAPIGRPFWRFAVRPNTPVQVYPARYLEAPQPPDGPRQWLCDLAVVGPLDKGFTVLEDCRVPFKPLTEQTDGGCCGVTLDPKGVIARGGLQKVVDALGPGGSLSLKPGTYVLQRPLVLTDKHNGLTIEGCSPGQIVLEPAPKTIKDFVFGLIVIENARDITLRGLDFRIEPVVTAGTSSINIQGANLQASSYTVAGVMVAHTFGIGIHGCKFRFNLPASGAAKDQAFGGGVIAINRVQGLTVRECEFLGTEFIGSHAICGVLSTIQVRVIGTTLDDVEISRCLFQRINVGVLGFAHLGMIRCSDNKVRNCAVGFLFADPNLGAANAFVRQSLGSDSLAGAPAYLSQGVLGLYQVALLVASVKFAEPFFARFDETPLKPVAAAARKVLQTNMTRLGTAAFSDILTPNVSMTRAAVTSSAPASMNTVSTSLSATRSTTTSATTSTAAQISTAEATVLNHASFNEALGHLDVIAIAADLVSFALDPVLHIRDNDIALIAPGGKLGPGIGVCLLFSLERRDVGTAMLDGNRVLTPDAQTVAAGLLFPAFAAVNANVLVQPTLVREGNLAPAFILMADKASRFEVVGNVIRARMLITPPRSNGAATTTWDFMNTEG